MKEYLFISNIYKGNPSAFACRIISGAINLVKKTWSFATDTTNGRMYSAKTDMGALDFRRY